MALLELKNLRVQMDEKKILNNVSMEFEQGRIHAIVGPNGAGKSTLSYTIMGLNDYRHAEGEIIFNNEVINNLDIHQRAARGITLGWQEPARYEGLTVKDFILAASQSKDNSLAEDALNHVGLDPALYLTRSVDKTLSGGERKRVEIASILVMQPKLVLMDEPDSGIDVAALDNIFNALQYLKSKGSTIILITHSPTVLKQAEYAFLLCHGRVADHGPISQINLYFEGKCIPCDHKNQPELDGGLK